MIYVIGDIHGRLDLLQDRLAAIQAHAAARGIGRPKVVFIGDYVDRGPDSKGVLELLSSAELREQIEPVCLLGNHDLALRNILAGADPSVEWMEEQGGHQTIASYGDFRARNLKLSMRKFRLAVPEAHKAFLADLALSHSEDGLFFSHAGVDPDKPLDAQPWQALVYGDRDLFEHDHQALASRLLERLGARVVHGPWAHKGVEVWAHRICVDSGCGYAVGKLSAVAIEGENVEVLS